jgi:PAS domain S-box-containing protein
MSSRQVLASWKEIAAFMQREVRTVQRWEQTRGLPVHRTPGAPRASIYAYTDELEEWLRSPKLIQDHVDLNVFLQVFLKSPDAMWLLDDKRVICDVNDAACRMLGAARGDLLGKKADEFVEDAESVPQRWSSLMRHKSHMGQVMLTAADGTVVEATCAACANIVEGMHLSILREIRRSRQHRDQAA